MLSIGRAQGDGEGSCQERRDSPRANKPADTVRCHAGLWSRSAYSSGFSNCAGLPRIMAFTPIALLLSVKLLAAFFPSRAEPSA